jgi:membrane protein DedA with SNARE-associated domain
MGYFFSIFFGTFVLEDVAVALALGLVANGQLGLWAAFLACFFGIAIGDLALYVLGYGLWKFGLENRFRSIRKFRAALVSDERSDILTYTVMISRFVPGTRLPTYLVAGLLRYPWLRFLVLTLVTVFAWVSLVFAFGKTLNSVLMGHWILTAVAILLALKITKFLVPKVSDSWERKALLQSWRRFLSFEFWPPGFFYLPVVPYYIFLSIKHGSPLIPFYANPEIENGGLIGESKWDFLKFLNPNSATTLKAVRIEPQRDFMEVRELLDREGISYPFVLKPDVGQRGFGVRIIRDDFDLTEYLLLADFAVIAQRLSRLSCEAGVFYVRPPSSERGYLFSITDKHFPVVLGDGRTKLGDLILRDPRARIIASTYFSRHRSRLDETPNVGEFVRLSECGNHCQGAIFRNGEGLKTPELEAAIHEILSGMPRFYFGRVDLRYKDAESLKKGEGFEIVEINGAGSEATHIWDPNTSLWEAYRTLFHQWDLLFTIGAEVKRAEVGRPRLYLGRFLSECVKVFFRKEPLAVSS